MSTFAELKHHESPTSLNRKSIKKDTKMSIKTNDTRYDSPLLTVRRRDSPKSPTLIKNIEHKYDSPPLTRRRRDSPKSPSLKKGGRKSLKSNKTKYNRRKKIQRKQMK